MWLNWKVRERACTRGRKVLRLVDGHNMFDRDCIVEEGASGRSTCSMIWTEGVSYADWVFSRMTEAICDLSSMQHGCKQTEGLVTWRT